jgi:threonine dehydrogenase-like Zn-dependent dehydrogenase
MPPVPRPSTAPPWIPPWPDADSDQPAFDATVPDAAAWALGVEAPGRLAFFAQPDPEPSDGGFRVETVYSGLSAGTELSYLKGTNPYLSAAFDPDYRVFDGQDAAATPYPIRSMGYMEVARVADSRAPGLQPGQLVAMRYGHANRHTAEPGGFHVPLPAGLDPLLGIYVAHMGPICANGLLHAAADVRGIEVEGLADGVRGQRVLIVGGGVVGLLTGLFARHCGADEVVVADPTPARRTAAEALGLLTVDDDEVPAWRWCKDRWAHGPGDRGADVAFQCRGRSGALAAALRALRPQRTVVDLAFYQGGAEDLRLGEEFHHNGLSVRCAQISRVPRGLAGSWDRHRLATETVGLLEAHGPAVRSALVTDVVPVAEAPAVVADLAARRRHALQVVFAFGAEATGAAGATGAKGATGPNRATR